MRVLCVHHDGIGCTIGRFAGHPAPDDCERFCAVRVHGEPIIAPRDATPRSPRKNESCRASRDSWIAAVARLLAERMGGTAFIRRGRPGSRRCGRCDSCGG